MTELKDKLALVVDDEIRITAMMRMNLESEGLRVVTAANGREALDHLREEMPDIIILDVMMSGMDGFETLRRIRTASQVPVIMLTAKDEEADRIKGLELGADDYVGKPFSHRELVSRIKAVLRRHYLPAPATLGRVDVDNRLSIDFNKREVLINGERINLRPTEYRLLYHLVQRAGFVMNHNELLAKVWGPEYHDETHYLRLYVTYLRQKIEVDPANPVYIMTERGVGYRFVEFQN
ncbi:MAG: response regulator transcription factor [Chloroflexota bacterium]|jgi:two-component system KDP operon response regulator KdpE